MRVSLAITLVALCVIAPRAMAQLPPFYSAWGSFGTGDGQFKTPVGLAVDSDGIVYVVDSNLHRVKKFTRDGVFLSQWEATYPAGIALGPDGNLYVTRTQDDVVSKYTKTGTLLAEWDAGVASTGIAVDVDGSVYVADEANVLRKFSSSGTPIWEWGEPDGDFFEGLDGVAADGMGHVYTAENYSCKVKKFTTDGTLILQWGFAGSGPGQLDNPVRLVTSTDGQWVYVVDYGNHRIQVFTNTGAYVGQIGSVGSGPGQFLNPIGIAVDAQGTVYVGDTNNSRIQLFGERATSTTLTSWGELKRRYR